MRAKNTIFVLFLVLVLYNTVIYFKQCLYYDVRIINGFTNNSSLPLVVWCTSCTTGNIGGRALQEHDDYSWTVKVTGLVSWSASRFICTVKWDTKRKEFAAFNLHRDRYRCGASRQCLWLVKEDGFYFSNNGVDWIKDSPWM